MLVLCGPAGVYSVAKGCSYTGAACAAFRPDSV